MTIESIIAEAVLQDSIKVIVGGIEHTVAQPTTATLIEASKRIAAIPEMRAGSMDEIFTTVLQNAKDCEYLGDIAAILILGKKNLIQETTETIVEKKYFGLLTKERQVKKVVDRKAELSEFLLNNYDPEHLNNLIVEIFRQMKMDFFFSITTFLSEINLLKKTKSETIASGQPSPELSKSTE
jgi:hypothetical protein